MYCSNCGKHNTEDSKFCQYCGSKLTKTSTKNESLSETKDEVDSPKTENNESSLKDKKVNAGLGSWLALVGLGLVVGLIMQISGISGYFPLLSNTYAIPGYSSLLWFEFLVGVVFIGYIIYLIYLYFKKNRKFPKTYIIYLVAYTAFSLLDQLWLASLSAPTQEMQKVINDALTQNSSDVSRNVVVAIIWILYMLKSKRVKATFIEDK